MKKRNKNILISLAIAFSILIVFYLSTKQTFYIQGIPEQSKIVKWNDIDIKLTSPYFGSINNVEGTEFCSKNDGFQTIANYFTSSNSFIASTLTSSYSGGCSGNFIEGEYSFPYSGVLKYTYNYDLSPGYNGASNGEGLLIKNSQNIYSNKKIIISGSGNCLKGGCREILQDTGSIKINKGDLIKTRVTSGMDISGTSNVSFILNFEKDLNQEEKQEIIEEINKLNESIDYEIKNITILPGTTEMVVTKKEFPFIAKYSLIIAGIFIFFIVIIKLRSKYK